jgi:hypothetical protein
MGSVDLGLASVVNSCIQWGFGKVVTNEKNGYTVYEHKPRAENENRQRINGILSKAGIFCVKPSECPSLPEIYT